MREVEDSGRWEGTKFVFDPPVEVPIEGGGVRVLRVVDTQGMVMEEGITREDVIHALLNAVVAKEGWDR